MPRNGLLIQHDWCTGCHACEVACKQEHNYSEGMCGIRVDELVTVSPDKVQVDFVPITTRFCDLCADRLKPRGGNDGLRQALPGHLHHVRQNKRPRESAGKATALRALGTEISN